MCQGSTQVRTVRDKLVECDVAVIVVVFNDVIVLDVNVVVVTKCAKVPHEFAQFRTNWWSVLPGTTI